MRRLRRSRRLELPHHHKKSASAAYFDQGLQLAYGFNHAERRRQPVPPKSIMPIARCAPGRGAGAQSQASMRRWSPTPCAPAIAARAQGAAEFGIRRARKSSTLTPRWRAASRTTRKAERSALDAQPTRRRCERLHHACPEDDNILALYAEALMNIYGMDNQKGKTPEIHHQSRESARPTKKTRLLRAPSTYSHPRGCPKCRPRRSARSTMRGVSPPALPGAGHLVAVRSIFLHGQATQGGGGGGQQGERWVGASIESLYRARDASQSIRWPTIRTSAVGVRPQMSERRWRLRGRHSREKLARHLAGVRARRPIGAPISGAARTRSGQFQRAATRLLRATSPRPTTYST